MSTPLRTLLEARSALALDLSADGREVLVASNLTGTMQIYLVAADASDGRLRRVTDLAEPVGAARFVPGSDDIVLSVDTGGDERHQLYLVDRAGGPLRDLVVETGVMHVLGTVSADGRLLAYVCNRRNGVDFDVFIRDLRSGDESCVMEGGGWNRALALSPDARYLLVERGGELPMDSDLHLVDLTSGTAVVVTSHEGAATAAWPTWYPDSRSFLFSFDLDREFMAIARYSLDEGSWRYVLEPQWDAMTVLSADGRRALVATNEDGVSHLRLHDGATLAPVEEIPLPGPGCAMGAAGVGDPLISRDGATAVFSFTRPVSPAEVYAYQGAEAAPRRVTNSPGATVAEIEPELHRVRSFDGLEVPLYLYRPPAVVDGRPPAVAFVIHGGPEGQAVPAYNPLILHLLDSGIAVVVPNVRGSTGYGRSYAHLDDVRLRLDSVRDLAAIHDWLPTAGLDAERAALTGGSYGGYMTLAGLAFQPGLWAAGVSIVGISSLVTFLENTSPYRRAIREREYGSLERDREFLLDASPLTHVASMRAPLLLIHGANDPRVPLSEAEQLQASLAARGVPCELLVYADEGHGLAKLANRLDAYPRIAGFLLHHLAAR